MMLADWIASNPDAAAAAIVTVGGFIYRKVTGKKTEDLKTTVMKIGRQVLPQLLQDAKLYDDAYVNERIRRTILAGLARLKVPESKFILALVDEAVEHIHGELAAQVVDYHLGKFIKVQSKTAEVLKTLPEDKPIDTTAPAAP